MYLTVTQNYANSIAKNQLGNSHLVARQVLLQENKPNKLQQSFRQVRTDPDKTSPTSSNAKVLENHKELLAF